MSTAPRRIVVVLDGPPTPLWQANALERLRDSTRLEVVDVRMAGAPRPRGAARRAHEAIERHLFALGAGALTPTALDLSDAKSRSLPAEAAVLVVWLAEQPGPSDASQVAGADAQLDVLYLRHGHRLEPAEEAFRRAALRGVPCVETEVLMRSGGRTVLVERTVSGARPFSSTLSRDKALWKIAALVARAAERAPGRSRSAAPAPGIDLPAAPTPGFNLPAEPDVPASAAPSTAELLVRSPPAWSRIVAARLLFDRSWQIRVRERGPEPTRGWAQTPDSLVPWEPGHLYADPFLFEHEGRHHLFCEDMPPGARRAVVSHTELHPDGTPSNPPTPVVSASCHLSYPFVFAHDGEVFMIPETSARQRVELYRAVDFPRVWRREEVLLEGLIASDATLLVHDDRLWLFVGVAVPHATLLDELHLCTATSLYGPWRAHPRNPIVSDVRCARPAGAIQRWGSRLVRPAQDCSRRYGGAVSFREIDELSVEDYSEHEIARLDPGDLGGGVRATHTYACDGRFEAVDLRRRKLRVGFR
jgi:hypothetical protein